MGQGVFSLNYRPDGSEGKELIDILADPNQDLPDQVMSVEARRQDIEEALCGLDDREGKVIRLHFGLEDGSSRTLAEIGSIFGLSRERIRQIKTEALRKLRNPSRGAKLFVHYAEAIN